MRPYSPLELSGRNIYLREGCYNCHSQLIRPFRDEAERYGHYSLAAESMYDHPFQWGSKRTGPDLARVGGKYSDAWQVAHLIDPRAVVPEIDHAGLSFLADPACDSTTSGPPEDAAIVGVPYTDEQIDNAAKPIWQPRPVRRPTTTALLKRYPKAAVGDFDGQPGRLTEMDALVAYLQVLGTLVDFTAVRPNCKQ